VSRWDIDSCWSSKSDACSYRQRKTSLIPFEAEQNFLRGAVHLPASDWLKIVVLLRPASFAANSRWQSSSSVNSNALS
jgi:hypothetical protein